MELPRYLREKTLKIEAQPLQHHSDTNKAVQLAAF